MANLTCQAERTDFRYKCHVWLIYRAFSSNSICRIIYKNSVGSVPDERL